MKAEFSSSARTQLTNLMHAIRNETAYAARAELLGDEDDAKDRADLRHARAREESAICAFFCALYEPVDVDVVRERKRRRR